MQKTTQIEQLLPRSRRLQAMVIVLTLTVLAATVLLTTRQVRARIREQISGRDGEVLQAVALMEQDRDAAEMNIKDSFADPANQLNVVLVTSRLRGVMGARLFDPSGKFVEAFPPNVREASVRADDLSRLRRSKSTSHFYSAMPPAHIFYPLKDLPASDRPLPLLEVNVPLNARNDGHLVGIAQFLIEGQSIATEFARLDQHLAFQSLVAFLAASAILVVIIGWAFRRLRQTHRLLAERTTDLLQANQELALAAKASAVGAVTSHLIHGLKGPLTGLQNFMARFNVTESEPPEAHWQQAAASTRRMHAMINQVVNVLREDEAGEEYEMTLAELAEIVTGRAQTMAREAGVQFNKHLETTGTLSNRTANLVTLILVNLIQNALQATPAGKTVGFTIWRDGASFVFEVCDEGPGFPENLENRLFVPCQSAKEGGCGIGLAISKQLANHLGASLELKNRSTNGCVFVLVLPAAVPAESLKNTTVTVAG